MADLTISQELRTAAAKLRASDHHGSIEGDTTNPALIELIANLLRAREPLAATLEHIADDMDDERAYEASPSLNAEAKEVVFTDRRVLRSDWTAALATARAINGTPADAATGGVR